MSLSDELLAHVWKLALVNLDEKCPFEFIVVNRRISRVALSVWHQRYDFDTNASLDERLSALLRHGHARRHTRYLAIAVDVDTTATPIRTTFAAAGQLFHLRSFALQSFGSATNHPFDEYLQDISSIATLQELILDVTNTAPITMSPPSFPVLRRLRISNGRLATWILQGSTPALIRLDLAVYSNDALPCIPWRTIRTVHVDLMSKGDQARALVNDLELLDSTVRLLILDVSNRFLKLIPALLPLGRTRRC